MSKPKIRVEGGKRIRKKNPKPWGVSALVLLSAVGMGFDRARQRLVERMYRKGETKDSLLERIENRHLSDELKELVADQVNRADALAPTAIEVESTVEDA